MLEEAIQEFGEDLNDINVVQNYSFFYDLFDFLVGPRTGLSLLRARDYEQQKEQQGFRAAYLCAVRNLCH